MTDLEKLLGQPPFQWRCVREGCGKEFSYYDEKLMDEAKRWHRRTHSIEDLAAL